MRYSRMEEAVFLKRENRFIAYVEKNGERIPVHVPNTGRCKELFLPGRKVLLNGAEPGSKRKTAYSLVTVDKDGMWVNIDSQAPNQLVADYLDTSPTLKTFGKIRSFRREVTYGDSRFDFYVEGSEGSGFIEVKGVTLEDKAYARFPDAPTTRGAKHIRELGDFAAAGEKAGVFFVVQMKGPVLFSPNDSTDPAFGDELRSAYKKGMEIFVMDTLIRGEHMAIDRNVSFDLSEPLHLVRAEKRDSETVLSLVRVGREKLKRDGVDQWQGKEPTEETIVEDILKGHTFIFKYDEDIVATAVLIKGEDPTYSTIDGAWQTSGDYVTIHRSVVSEKYVGKGMGRRMMHRIKLYAATVNVGSIRVDTHEDNKAMRALIEGSGFTYCGIITVADGTKRVAYEWSLK